MDLVFFDARYYWNILLEKLRKSWEKRLKKPVMTVNVKVKIRKVDIHIINQILAPVASS
jgi:hypothetical protein